MQQERECAFGVGRGGGRGLGEEVLKTCEVYNISTNEWQFIGSLNVPRLWGNMVCVNGTLYVLGGSQSVCRSEYTVESYNPRENLWTQKTSTPYQWTTSPKKRDLHFLKAVH